MNPKEQHRALARLYQSLNFMAYLRIQNIALICIKTHENCEKRRKYSSFAHKMRPGHAGQMPVWSRLAVSRDTKTLSCAINMAECHAPRIIQTGETSKGSRINRAKVFAAPAAANIMRETISRIGRND